MQVFKKKYSKAYKNHKKIPKVKSFLRKSNNITYSSVIVRIIFL